MVIYVVIHYYDNGESYEDYREYQDSYLFSTENKASTFYWERVINEYEGQYKLFKWELDTQVRHELEASVYLKCRSMYDTDDYYNYNNTDYNGYEYNISDDYSEYDDYNYITEIQAETYWLNTPREQAIILGEIEEDKLLDELHESDAFWNNLELLD